MALMKTSNPALGEKTFQDMANAGYAARYGGQLGDQTARMTLNGTVNKTGILLVLAVATAGWTWLQFMQSHDIASVMPWLLVGGLGGFICAMVTVFKKDWAPVTAPAYALLEGLVLGSLSAVFDLRYPGIAIQAVGLTFGTLFVLLFLYRTGVIKVTDKLRLGIFARQETPMGYAEDRARAVESALSQIEKQFGKGSIMRLGREGRDRAHLGDLDRLDQLRRGAGRGRRAARPRDRNLRP
jgi:uncharacterized YccA/Bax inhibitor family protein